jgi:uncharacterized oxidoreductase
MKSFDGKTVLITGGTSGIGLALAKAFYRRGAGVAVCARSERDLKEFQNEYPGTLAVRADLTNLADQQTLLVDVASRFGSLDILVNNAGRLIERDFAGGQPSPEELADELTLNLVAPVQLTALATARWPSLDAVVIVSSGYALVSPRRAPTYGAAKAGLHAFANGLRRQLEPKGTHVLEVLPPTVDTPATAHRAVKKVSAHEVAEATLDALAKRRPMALIGQTRLLPTMLRLAPRTIEQVVAQT